MNGLNIAPGFVLPLEAVTETFVILAKRGSGKTYTANVMAEEMVGAGHPVVIIDPIGVWWGLRSSSDAESDGLPVAIFGGDHADLPLDEHSGTIIADAIVAERFSAILDLSHLSKSAARRFMTSFLERLYHRNRDPLHIFVDEADSFAPQRAAADGARLLGAMEDLVRRGRARGLGCTLITQRPAVLHKDVLSQAEVLICLRMTGVRDVAAIDEWVKLHDVDDQAAELKKSLPSLPVGTAWVWSPGWLERLDKVQIRKRTTFDSSATPKIGQTRIVPKQMADIDLQALGEKISSTAEEVKANDPKVLKAEIIQLKREASKQAAEVIHELVEVSVLTDTDRDMIGQAAERLAEALAEVASASTLTIGVTRDLIDLMREKADVPLVEVPRFGQAERTKISNRVAPTVRTIQPRRDTFAGAGGSTAGLVDHRPGSLAGMTKANRLILATLAQYGPKSQAQIALLTGYAAKGGGFNNALGSLRSSGLISGGKEHIELTDAGAEAAADVPPLPSGQELIDHWRGRLGKAERLIFDALLDIYPDDAHRDDIAGVTGYAPGGGGFNNAIGRLRSFGLLFGSKDAMKLADEIGSAL